MTNTTTNFDKIVHKIYLSSARLTYLCFQEAVYLGDAMLAAQCYRQFLKNVQKAKATKI